MREVSFSRKKEKVNKPMMIIVLQILLISIWLFVGYYACNRDGKLNYFLFWLFTGAPFGIRKMSFYFYPIGFDFAGGLGVLAMNLLLGGLIGGIILVFKIIGLSVDMIKVILGMLIYKKN